MEVIKPHEIILACKLIEQFSRMLEGATNNQITIDLDGHITRELKVRATLKFNGEQIGYVYSKEGTELNLSAKSEDIQTNRMFNSSDVIECASVVRVWWHEVSFYK